MSEGESVSRFFNNGVPPAAMAAYQAGQARMQNHLAQAKASAKAVERSARKPAPQAAPAAPQERDISDVIAHCYHVQAQFNLPPDTVADLKARGIPYHDMLEPMIQMHARTLAAENPNTHRASGAGSRILSDERETLRDRIVGGLADRLSNAQPSAAGSEFAHMPLSKIAEVASKQRLGEVRAEAGGSGHSSSDFVPLLGAAAGKALTRSYELQRSPLVRLCGIDPNLSTFQPVARITLEPGPALELVGENGEVQSGTFADSKETIQLHQFARIFDLSRPAFLSDDVGGFQRMISEWARVTASLEASLIVSALTTQTMSDGQVLFHSTHSNVAGSAAAISDTTLEEGSLAMLTATANDHIVGVEPRFLVVSAAKRIAAAKALAVITPASSSDVNVWAGALELISSPHLDASSSTAWYMFADPAVAQVLVLGYYGGRVGPTLVAQEGFRHLGYSFRLSHDVAVGFTGTIGCWKNGGA